SGVAPHQGASVLPVPLRPGDRRRTLPHVGVEGVGDHGRVARPHVRARHPHLRGGQSARRRQDPAHAQLPGVRVRRCGRVAELRRDVGAVPGRGQTGHGAADQDARCQRVTPGLKICDHPARQRADGPAQDAADGCPRRRPRPPPERQRPPQEWQRALGPVAPVTVVERDLLRMRIGITYDLRQDAPLPVGAPDDLYEEFDGHVTVAAIADVLRGLGHDVIELGNGKEMLEKLLADPPEFVFNFAEGQGIGRSRESRVPAVLEMLGIPYTGSDGATQGLCLDQDRTKRSVYTAHVQTPGWNSVALAEEMPDDPKRFPTLAGSGLSLPVIAKPSYEGSSKGIRNKCLIEKPEDFGPTVVALWKLYHQPIMVEEFI